MKSSHIFKLPLSSNASIYGYALVARKTGMLLIEQTSYFFLSSNILLACVYLLPLTFFLFQVHPWFLLFQLFARCVKSADCIAALVCAEIFGFKIQISTKDFYEGLQTSKSV